MERKPNLFDKIGAFVSGKGFYFVVLLCVAAIALSGYYLIRGVRTGLTAEDEPASASSPIIDLPTPTPSPSVPASPAPSAQPPAQSLLPSPKVTAAPQPSASAAPAQSQQPKALVFTWPVNGEVIAGYTVKALAYDETMGDWRTHAGLDIAAAAGTPVKAAADGTVTAVWTDDYLGTLVTVDHGDGLTSVYANLAAAPTVKEGDAVRTGTVLGSVGDTAVTERGRGAHLHFAMYRGGAALDPEDYLPAQ